MLTGKGFTLINGSETNMHGGLTLINIVTNKIRILF